jgi:broad specificity phosphatase PhoE
MKLAIEDARKNAVGHEAVCVSHQLPIWVARLDGEKRSFLHDPRKRQCSLASLTSFVFDDDKLVSIEYSEPAVELVTKASKGAGA